MFTGIIEAIGTIKSIVAMSSSPKLSVNVFEAFFEDLSIGDSVSVDGVCLTVSEIKKDTFIADVMHETFKRSNLGKLKTSSKVNLERALPANGRFGGHIVTGHIDGVGVIGSIRKEGNAILLRIKANPNIMRYIVEKGSIAIDGISLTVIEVTADSFSVSLIPHSAQNTTLSQKVIGDVVNLENDIIGKYVEKLILNVSRGATCHTQESTQSKISKEFLERWGIVGM